MFTELKAEENISHLSRWAGIKIHKGILTYYGFHGRINFKKAVIVVVCFILFSGNTTILIEKNTAETTSLCMYSYCFHNMILPLSFIYFSIRTCLQPWKIKI
jgi:hypothetical protein